MDPDTAHFLERVKESMLPWRFDVRTPHGVMTLKESGKGDDLVLSGSCPKCGGDICARWHDVGAHYDRTDRLLTTVRPMGCDACSIVGLVDHGVMAC